MAACISGKPPTVATHLPIVIPPNGMRGHAPWHGHPMARVLPLEVTIKRFRYGRSNVQAKGVFHRDSCSLFRGPPTLAPPWDGDLPTSPPLPATTHKKCQSCLQ